MKKVLLVFLALFLSVSEISSAQSQQNKISLRIDVTPNPIYNQVETGKSYVFLLTIENTNITLKEGDLVEQPDSRFSGNLTVKVEYLLGKSGYITYGSNSMIYGAVIDRWERSYAVGLPDIDGLANVSFVYNCSQSYDPRNATLSEWLKLTLKITVYIEEFTGQDQNRTFLYGPTVASYEASYFIINDEKILYVKDKLLEIEGEINDAIRYRSLIENITGQTFYLDLAGPMNDYHAMRDFVDMGDYVSAMNVTRYWWYDVKQELIDSLLSNYEAYSGFKATAVQYRDQLDMVQIELNQLNTTNQYYLTSIVGLVALSIFLFFLPKLRVPKKKVELKQPAEPKKAEPKEPEKKEEEPVKLEEPEESKKPRKRIKIPEEEDADLDRARSLLDK